MSINRDKTEPFGYTDEKVEKNEFLLDYKSCLMKLTPRERNILLLCFDDEFNRIRTNEEISKIVKIPSSLVDYTIKNSLARIGKMKEMQKHKHK